MKRGWLLIAAGLASVGLLAAPAAADAPKVRSTVDIHGRGPDPEYNQWVGHVHSQKRKCERRRTVTMYYEEPGKTEKIGTDKTDRRGHWQIPYLFFGDDDPYYARVSRKVVGSGENKIVCKPDQSPDVRSPFKR